MTEATWHEVRTMLTDRQVIEPYLLIGHYQGLASAIGGLAIAPEISLP